VLKVPGRAKNLGRCNLISVLLVEEKSFALTEKSLIIQSVFVQGEKLVIEEKDTTGSQREVKNTKGSQCNLDERLGRGGSLEQGQFWCSPK